MLCGSGLLNLILIAASAAKAGGAADEHFQEAYVAGKRTQSDKVLLLKLNGAIMPTQASGLSPGHDPVATMHAELDQATKDDHVKAILLEIDSPGGGITASDIIYHDIKAFRDKTHKPVVTLCMDLTASGGYYAASATDFIMAHQTSLVGSIGVIAEFPNVTDLIHKIGFDMIVVKSQRANGSESFKDIGSPFRAMKPGERKVFQDMITAMWNRFVDVVTEGRHKQLQREQVADLADGRIWVAPKALELKLIDGLGYESDAWKKAADLGQAGDAKLVTYRQAGGVLRELLGGEQRQTQLEERLDMTLERYAPDGPRFMYLWTGR
jgi:protease-4